MKMGMNAENEAKNDAGTLGKKTGKKRRVAKLQFCLEMGNNKMLIFAIIGWVAFAVAVWYNVENSRTSELIIKEIAALKQACIVAY